MTSVMQNYGLLWTDPDGAPQASAGRYDKRSAKRRRTELQAAGCTRVEIVPVRPEEVPEPVSRAKRDEVEHTSRIPFSSA